VISEPVAGTGPNAAPLVDAARVAVEVGGFRGVLAIKPFRKLWIALSLSSFGDWLGFLAQTALAAQLATGHTYLVQNSSVGLVVFVRLLPAVLLAPLAGAFADRLDRRLTMVIADIGRFSLYVSIPIVHTLWWLFIATFLIETLSLFWIPAKEATVPNLVPRDRLEQANQLSLLTTYGSAPVAALVFALLSTNANVSELKALCSPPGSVPTKTGASVSWVTAPVEMLTRLTASFPVASNPETTSSV